MKISGLYGVLFSYISTQQEIINLINIRDNRQLIYYFARNGYYCYHNRDVIYLILHGILERVITINSDRSNYIIDTSPYILLVVVSLVCYRLKEGFLCLESF